MTKLARRNLTTATHASWPYRLRLSVVIMVVVVIVIVIVFIVVVFTQKSFILLISIISPRISASSNNGNSNEMTTIMTNTTVTGKHGPTIERVLHGHRGGRTHRALVL